MFTEINLRERLRQLDKDEHIGVIYVFFPEKPVFEGPVWLARKWANQTWTYKIVDEDVVGLYKVFYVKRLGED